MKLRSQPFNAIKSGKKIIEIRVYDKKRKTINLGDEIEFTKTNNKEKIKTKVIGLLRYKTFTDLINDYPLQSFGTKNKNNLLNNIYKYYTKKKENKYGVLGIRIKTIKKFDKFNEI